MNLSNNYQCEGQLTIFDIFSQDILFGKMSTAHSVQTTEKISAPSSKKPSKLLTKTPMFLDLRTENGQTQDASWVTDIQSLGEYMMHNIGECHNAGEDYVFSLITGGAPHQTYYLNCSEKPMKPIHQKLSEILERHPDAKYNLSPRACLGILQRAERRGKELPPILKQALERQSVSKNEPGNPGGGKGILIQTEKIGTLSTLNNQSVVYSLQGSMIGRNDKNGPQGDGVNKDDIFVYNAPQHHGWKDANGVCAPLTAGQNESIRGGTPLVTYGLDRASYNQGRNAKYDFSIDEEQIGCQTAKGPGAVGNSSVVRRLTPLECTRLQGFPDGWMDIGEWVDSKGKLHKDSDAAKYKAAGNSIALPFWQWLMHRIFEHLKKDDSTMASLFDGIGGFPLCSMRAGITPVWASEIEEFPMAVTKYRFGID